MAAPALHLSWANPVHIHWGAGCFQSLTTVGPVVVLADRAALRYDHETALLQRLGAHCKAWGWYTGGLASVAMAQGLCDALWPALRSYPDATVLAIGGGSTLDLAKLLRYPMDSSAQAADHWRSNTLPPDCRSHPLWLVPTTAGTGSEVTRWATVWDTDIEQPTKLSWSPTHGFAQAAWVDPELSAGCPIRLSRDCALDSLAHALEALWNRNDNPIAEALAVNAAQLVLRALPELLHADQRAAGQAPAREALARASLLAGMAMSQTQTALAHALSYDLTLHQALPHGEACAVWLPMVWELALGASPACDAALARVFGVPAAEGVQQLRAWLQRMDIAPRELRSDSAGRQLLDAEMRSPRGRNFIGAPRGERTSL